MREILFRGKHLDTEEWVYGVPLFEVNRSYMIEDLFISPKYQCTGAVNSIVDPETVGQYTGLTDKNGKKIFEGDIIKLGNKVSFVFFGISSFRHTRYGKHAVDLLFNYADNCEIIGNIHDNPELLKEAEQE